MNIVQTGRADFSKSFSRASLVSSICCFSERRFLTGERGGGGRREGEERGRGEGGRGERYRRGCRL